MSSTKFLPAWLYQTHSPQELAHWAQHLRYFRFWRAWGGHANDGDEFKVTFAFADRADLLHQLGHLGLVPHPIAPDAPRPVVGQAYTGEQWQAFQLEIPAFPDLEQPGHSQVLGQAAHVWVSQQTFSLSVMGTRDGNLYEVTATDFVACQALETHFDRLGWSPLLDRGGEQSVQCVSPVHYPELFRP